ncbi:unnamed protein product [Ectocarpus sp. 4 AP-2014]
MKALHRVTRWRWRSSKCSKSNTSPEEPEQPEDALAVRRVVGNCPPVGQLEPNGHQEGEETKVDPPGHSYGPKQLIAEGQLHGEDNADDGLLSEQEQSVRDSDKEIQELRASLLQLHDDRRRSEEMAAARMKAVEGEKAALEVVIQAERAKTAMQQKTMHFLRQTSIEAQSVETRLRNELQTLKNEKSQGTNGHSDKKEKMRSGLARLVEKDLRKRIVVLEHSNRQQVDEIRSLLTPQEVLQRNGGSHFDRILTVGNSQGGNATLSALYDGSPDCTRLRADFLSAWRLNGLAIERIFRITVPADVRAKHDKYARSHRTLVQRFHGTSCRSTCNLILDPKSASPCGLQLCNVCNICLQGFKLGKSSTRFGRGVYFSSRPAKSNAYAQGTEKKENGQRLRCMFVADVVKGTVFFTKKRGFDGGTYPPPGYNSVQAEGAIEVVYDEDAALPTHLIVYSLP